LLQVVEENTCKGSFTLVAKRVEGDDEQDGIHPLQVPALLAATGVGELCASFT